MPNRLSRRAMIAGALAAPLLDRSGRARTQPAEPAFGYPIGLPDRVPGDGLLVRHGYACENTWYNPGWLHAGEDWYTLDGDTAGALIYAVAEGEVVFVGSEYPGRVVIVRHAPDLYSMYGHLDYEPAVDAGEPVARGQTLGAVLPRTDGRAPSHLHFEMRTFLTTTDVNGDAPRYGVACGFQCPPGPGYWPIDAPEHPSDLGWRNPTHVLAGDDTDLPNEAVVASQPSAAATPILSAPPEEEGSRRLADLALEPGTRYPLLDIRAGAADSTGTSAEAYQLWYRLRLPDGRRGWIQAAAPSSSDTGSDGRPSSVRFDLLPVTDTTP